MAAADRSGQGGQAEMSQTGAMTIGAARQTRRRMSPSRWWRSPWIVPLPGFLLLLCLSLPPFLYALYLSFVDVDIAVQNRPVSFVGLDNYLHVLGSDVGLQALGITLLISFGSTFATIVVGLVISYLIH